VSCIPKEKNLLGELVVDLDMCIVQEWPPQLARCKDLILSQSPRRTHLTLEEVGCPEVSKGGNFRSASPFAQEAGALSSKGLYAPPAGCILSHGVPKGWLQHLSLHISVELIHVVFFTRQSSDHHELGGIKHASQCSQDLLSAMWWATRARCSDHRVCDAMTAPRALSSWFLAWLQNLTGILSRDFRPQIFVWFSGHNPDRRGSSRDNARAIHLGHSGQELTDFPECTQRARCRVHGREDTERLHPIFVRLEGTRRCKEDRAQHKHASFYPGLGHKIRKPYILVIWSS
jgi:hypothetical protein